MTRYTYRPDACLLTVKMATQMHGTMSDWAKDLIDDGEEAGAYKGGLALITHGRITSFEGEYENM